MKLRLSWMTFPSNYVPKLEAMYTSWEDKEDPVPPIGTDDVVCRRGRWYRFFDHTEKLDAEDLELVEEERIDFLRALGEHGRVDLGQQRVFPGCSWNVIGGFSKNIHFQN